MQRYEITSQIMRIWHASRDLPPTYGHYGMICAAGLIQEKERIKTEEQLSKRYPQSRYAKVIGEYCYRAIEREAVKRFI